MMHLSLRRLCIKLLKTKKINAVNGRKEFFRVTLEEIEAVVKANHDKSVDFTKDPEAQHYRESLRIRNICTEL